MDVKVYGINAWAPNHWKIETAPNGNRQRYAVVAAPSLRAALAAFAEVGVEVTPYHFRQYGYPDAGGAGAEVALSDPGVVFYAPSEYRCEYVRAETP